MSELNRRDFLRLGAMSATAATAAVALGPLGAGSGGLFSAGASTKGIDIIDQRGVKVHLDRPARRVITIPIPTASMLMSVEEGASWLVGMNPSSEAAIVAGIMNDIYPRAQKVPTSVCDSNFNPNIETILQLRPDVVIQWADHGQAILTPLENAGITTVGLNYGTQDDLVEWIRLFGAILGKPHRAARINKYLATILTQVQANVPKNVTNPPKILYFQSALASLKVAGTQTYNDYYINLVGGVNAAASVTGMPTVTIEQIITWNPDIILVGNFDAATPSTFLNNPSLQSVSAVKSNRVYKVPLGGYRWDPPGQESALMWRWLSQIAYPTVKAPTNLRDDIKKDYKLLYSYHPDESQINGILQMSLNSNTANYGRFNA